MDTGFLGRGRSFWLPVVPVRVRILAAMLAVTALGLAVTGGSAFLLQQERQIAAVDVELLIRLDSVRAVVDGAGPIATSPGTAGPTLPDRVFTDLDDAMTAVLERVLPGTFESTIGLVGGDPRYVPGVAQSFELTNDPAFLRQVVRDTAGGKSVMATADSPLGTLRYVAIPITLEGIAGQAVYVTAVHLEGALSDLNGVFSTYVVLAVAAMVMIGLVGWFVSGRLLAPLRRLSSAASRITATGLHARIPVRGRDDVSELTRAVNEMVERLERSFASQQRLLDDVRHELSTPITIVRGHLELLDASDPDDVEATRALTIDELDRMSLLVSDIATLAKAERDGPATTVLTDVAELSHQVLAKARGIAGHSWAIAETADIVTALDPYRITQAWLQLAENAAKYSDQGTEIVLGSRLTGDTVEFWVTDLGPGIPDDAHARIFERFGRVDARRGISGSGLGLAIVAAIAAAHGGSVAVDSVVGRGSRFVISIPHVPADSGGERPRSLASATAEHTTQRGQQ